jgi:hypothetical protein
MTSGTGIAGTSESENERAWWRKVHSQADEAIAEADRLALMARARASDLLLVPDIFMPLPPVNWVCEPLDIAPGPPALVAGYGYSGKTLTLQDYALAVASGTPAWGRFPVRTGRVLHLDYEQGAHLTRMRYQRLARARGIDPRELEDRLALAVMPRVYLDADPKDEIPRIVDGFDVVIVDSFKASCPTTEENASGARIPLDKLTRLSEATGATPIVIHHARKPSQNPQGGARMGIRGSGALYDACGSVLVFSAEKGEPITVQHEKAKITGKTHPDFRLWIEDVEVDGDPLGGLRVSVMSDAVTGTAGPDPFNELKARVVALVQQEGGVFHGGKNAIRARLRVRSDDVGAAIEDLCNSGTLRSVGSHQTPILALGTTP